MASDREITTQVQIKVTTRERLKSVGTKGETYDDVINRALDCIDKQRKLNEWPKNE